MNRGYIVYSPQDSEDIQSPYDIDYIETNYLSYVHWPISKNEIIEWVQYYRADTWLLNIMQYLPDGQYTLPQFRYHIKFLL